jgi:hypothetical protein
MIHLCVHATVFIEQNTVHKYQCTRVHASKRCGSVRAIGALHTRLCNTRLMTFEAARQAIAATSMSTPPAAVGAAGEKSCVFTR